MIAPVDNLGLEDADFGRSSDPNLQDIYRQRLRLTMLRPLHVSHKIKALGRHLESQKEVELRILKRLFDKDVIEQVEAARRRLSSSKRKPSVCKGREQERVYRRRTSRTSTTVNVPSRSPWKEHHPGRLEHAMKKNSSINVMNDDFEDPPMLDTSYQPLQTTKPLSPATFTSFPADARISAFSIPADESGLCEPYYNPHTSTFPFEDWPMSENNFLPTMVDPFDVLPPFSPHPFSIGTQLPVQIEDVATTEKSLGVRCDMTSTADRLARLPSYSNTLFPPADAKFSTMSDWFDGGELGDS